MSKPKRTIGMERMTMTDTPKVRMVRRGMTNDGLDWIDDPDGTHALVERELWERVVREARQNSASHVSFGRELGYQKPCACKLCRALSEIGGGDA